MADVKITEYPELVAPTEDDVLEIVDDPAGTPLSRKVKLKSLLDVRLNYSINGADLALAAGTALQVAFPATGDIATLLGNTTYEVEGSYFITKSVTSCTTALAFSLGATTITFILLQVNASNSAANVVGTTPSFTLMSQTASTVINATAAGEVVIKFKGLLRVGTGGTVTPQIQFSAAPTTPIMKAGSYIKFTPIGTTNNVQGALA